MTEPLQVDIAPDDLESLDELWAGGLGQAYEAYRRPGRDTRVALAAALVETAVALQGVGSHIARPMELLLGDLCLARASRLLADIGDQSLQIAFARVIERVASAAAAALEVPAVRPMLSAAIEQT
jgi:hypothetical protein